MFERFTADARRAIILAQENARMLRHDYIGTEHLLLGLMYDDESTTRRILQSMGITFDAVRDEVRERIGFVREAQGHMPFTPRARKVLELSLREALQLGQRDDVCPEHILLGLVRQGEGVAFEILCSFGLDMDNIRQRALNYIRKPPHKATKPGDWVIDLYSNTGGARLTVEYAFPRRLERLMWRYGDTKRSRYEVARWLHRYTQFQLSHQ